MSYIKRLSPEEAKKFGFEVKPMEGNRNPRYSFSKQKLEEFGLPQQPYPRQFKEVLRKLDKNGEVISTVEKLQSEPIDVPDHFEIKKISTSKTTGQQWIQYGPKSEEAQVNEIDFDSIIKKYIEPLDFKPTPRDTGVFYFDRLVYTDVHTGMTPNKNSYSLYGGKWDEKEMQKRLELVISHVLENQKGDTLFIDDLGDFADGYDGKTVRREHDLPQNMDNQMQFDVGLDFKVRMLDGLAMKYSKIVCNNITDDNHAGSFGYIINSAFKRIVEYKYKHVQVNNLRRFINHYTVGQNCFILTHGKDGKNLKFGFKPILDTKQIEKIDNYIKEHKLYDYNIEFSKGDSHQKIFDESTSDTFDYYNYPAFSPSSEWVQTNFKRGMSGFEFFNFRKDGSKSHHPYKFKWEKGRKDEVYSY